MKLHELLDSIGFDVDKDGHDLLFIAAERDFTTNEVHVVSDIEADACDIALCFDQDDENYNRTQTSRDFSVSLEVTYEDVVVSRFSGEVLSVGRRTSRLNVCAF